MGNYMKILAVDDEKLMLERLEDCIREACPSCDMVSFSSPSRALQYARELVEEGNDEDGSGSCSGRPIDVAFLDISMRGMDGVTLAERLIALFPRLNVIFTTAYSDYALEAYGINASGYLLKPIGTEDLERQLQCLRYPVEEQGAERLILRCFGNFDAFVGGKCLNFKYEKTRELLAYLTDRCGNGCSMDEIMAVLWEEGDHSSYLRNLRKDLLDTLKQAGVENAIDKGWGRLAIRPEVVECDYYAYKNGESNAKRAYIGEYMTQYSWAENTNGFLFAQRAKEQ